MGSATLASAAPSYASPSCTLTTASTGALRGRHRHTLTSCRNFPTPSSRANSSKAVPPASSPMHFHPTSAAGTGRQTSLCARGRHRRTAQRNALLRSDSLTDQTLLPNNLHLASLVATLAPICRLHRDACALETHRIPPPASPAPEILPLWDPSLRPRLHRPLPFPSYPWAPASSSSACPSPPLLRSRTPHRLVVVGRAGRTR